MHGWKCYQTGKTVLLALEKTNPRIQSKRVCRSWQHTNVILTKIRHTKTKGSKATALQRFRRKEGKYHHLWQSEEQSSAKEMWHYSSPLPRYLSGVPAAELSFSSYFLQQRPETVCAALAKQKQREEYRELTREKRARESTQSQDKRKSSTSRSIQCSNLIVGSPPWKTASGIITSLHYELWFSGVPPRKEKRQRSASILQKPMMDAQRKFPASSISPEY